MVDVAGQAWEKGRGRGSEREREREKEKERERGSKNSKRCSLTSTWHFSSHSGEKKYLPVTFLGVYFFSPTAEGTFSLQDTLVEVSSKFGCSKMLHGRPQMNWILSPFFCG
uniref:Uncharacterized protein n=1 Tax=Micrurus spixii TaxID=129469 RepID=A0A2D4MMW7_9SAUR